MADDTKNADQNDRLNPEEINPVVSASPSTRESAEEPLSADPADEIPVPIAMSPAEIDERAQAVEAVRGNLDPESGMQA